MKNPFKKKLYSAVNAARNKILIVADDEESARIVAFRIKFVKDARNAEVKDVSDEYLTYDRYRDGLNFDKLDNGQFIQRMQGIRRKWITKM